MRSLEVRPSSETANRVFWGLVVVWALVSLSFAVVWMFLFSSWAPAAWTRVCAMWTQTLPPVAHVAAALLALLGLVSGVVAVGTLVAQVARTRRFIRELSRRRGEVPRSLAALAEAMGLGGRVDVVDDGRPYAFTYGWRCPRIAVSRALLETLDSSELQAVLLHELYHVRQHGPARLALVRAIARGLFFLPATSDLARSYTALEELAADGFAIYRLGDRWALASALVKVGRCQQQPAGLVVAQVAGADTSLSLRSQVRLTQSAHLPGVIFIIVRCIAAICSSDVAATASYVAAISVDPAEAERIWEPFYRSDRARSRQQVGGGRRGYGLGLATVRWIVEAHGGRVHADGRPGQGASVGFRLPVLACTQPDEPSASANPRR